MILLLLNLGCIDELRASCRNDAGCSDEAACVRGVCQGQPCSSTGDCSGAMECATVLGSRVCALPCAGDADCYGETVCQDVSESSESDAPEARLCF